MLISNHALRWLKINTSSQSGRALLIIANIEYGLKANWNINDQANWPYHERWRCSRRKWATIQAQIRPNYQTGSILNSLEHWHQ